MAKPATIDEYIARTKGTFAYPILVKIRQIVQDSSSEVKEEIKWGAPSFEYKGLMMSMVKFKTNTAVWFHKGALFNDTRNLLEASSENTKSMRKYIIPSLEDLDEEGLRDLILEAISIQESGEQVVGYNQSSEDHQPHSELLFRALEHDAAAKVKFDDFPPYKQKEFIQHIESAKREHTKTRRLEKCMRLIRQGIGLHDKYR